MNKEELKERRRNCAITHTKDMAERYSYDIACSFVNTETYGGVVDISGRNRRYDETSVELLPSTIQDALQTVSIDKGDKVAILNFASYKHPGGGFILGMMSQEEAICHSSTLYNVLEKNMGYYVYNQKNLNKGLYQNRALYTPDIVFEFENHNVMADVITCAAPNLSPILRYGSLPMAVCYEAIAERIDFVFRVAIKQEVDVLFLGAFGCGVFKNNPYWVACLMNYYTKKYNGYIKKIIHPIPDADTSINYDAFKSVLSGDLSELRKNVDLEAMRVLSKGL